MDLEKKNCRALEMPMVGVESYEKLGGVAFFGGDIRSDHTDMLIIGHLIWVVVSNIPTWGNDPLKPPTSSY